MVEVLAPGFDHDACVLAAAEPFERQALIAELAVESLAARRARPHHCQVMCHSKLVPRDVERAMEDTEDVDVPVVLYQVRDPVVPI